MRVLTLYLAVIALGWFLVTFASHSRTSYWILRDGQEGTARLTEQAWTGHGVYAYEYSVGRTRFSGRSVRSWKSEKDRKVGVGGTSSVFYSKSHPWLSSLVMPDAVVEGLPVAMVAVLLEFLLVLTILAPESKWALRTGASR